MAAFGDLHEIASMSRQEFEERCMDMTEHCYMGKQVVLCKILTRYKLYVDTRDVGVAPHLILDGFWESWMTQCLARVVKPGDYCIDIGANFGYYSLVMSALAGNEGRTIAIEPNPGIFDLLKASEAIHPHRFEVAHTALGNFEGDAILTFPDRFPGGGTLLREELVPGKSQARVPVTTLDALVRKYALKKVDVIKIDVEGLEPEVFAGMEETIRNNPQLKILIEYSPFMYRDAAAFSDYLVRNFTIHRIKDVDEPERLSAEGMQRLLRLTDHTDLFLERK